MRLIEILNDYIKIFFPSSKNTAHLYDLDYVKKIKIFSENIRWKTEIQNSINKAQLNQVENGLDIGCNAGIGTEFVGKLLNVKMYGVDTSLVAIEYANNHFKNSKNFYKYYDGNTLPFPSNNFDFVCSFHVIGHVNNVENFLKEAKRVLKNKKKIILVTPNAYYKIFALLDSLVNFYKPDKTVLKYWFPEKLKKILVMNGFENINFVYDGQLPILFKFFSFLSIFKSRLVIIATKKDN